MADVLNLSPYKHDIGKWSQPCYNYQKMIQWGWSCIYLGNYSTNIYVVSPIADKLMTCSKTISFSVGVSLMRSIKRSRSYLGAPEGTIKWYRAPDVPYSNIHRYNALGVELGTPVAKQALSYWLRWRMDHARFFDIFKIMSILVWTHPMILQNWGLIFIWYH